MTVLCWLKKSKQWKQYVRARVEEIQRKTDIANWRFCPGNENPADIPSRSYRVSELVQNQLWWEGPPFLKSSLEGWPDLPTRHESDLATDEQVRNIHFIVHSLPAVTYDLESLNLDMIIDVRRYSSRLKLLRVTALVMKFVTQLKEKATEVNHRDTIAMYLREAESRWVKSIQRSSFADSYCQESQLFIRGS